MAPKISVVIPLYNKELYIQRAIDSVLNQSFQNFELIIIDSSSDRSTYIVKQYADPRIIHIIRERTRAAPARNLGVQLAHSDFIAFIDADDEWQPDHLESLISLREKFPDAGLYSTPYVKLKPDGRPRVMLFVGINPPPWEGYLPDYLWICSRGDEPVNSSSCAIPRDVFSRTGGFPEKLEYGEDQFLWGKISLSYPVAYSWQGLAVYHTDASGRICDELHDVTQHPFSEYLKTELMKNTIPQNKRDSCYAYIRRKRITDIFGSAIVGKKNRTCSDILGNKEINQHQRIWNNFKKRICRFLKQLHDSDLHDSLRLFTCWIFRYHNPGKDYENHIPVRR